MKRCTTHRGAKEPGEQAPELEVKTEGGTASELAQVYSFPFRTNKSEKTFTYNTGASGCKAFPAYTDVKISALNDDDRIAHGAVLLVKVCGIEGLFEYRESGFGPELRYMPSGLRVSASDDIELLGVVANQESLPISNVSSNPGPPPWSA